MTYKFILWGVGAVYNKLFNCIKYYEMTGAIQIEAVVDKHISKCLYTHIDGYELIMPKDIIKIAYDYIVILSDKYFGDIRTELIEMGINPVINLKYNFFQLPNVNVDKFIKLKNSNISIVSNNCWGGSVYRSLGLECLSPFKNLFLEDGDYLRLLDRLPYYLACDPILYKYVYDRKRNMEYPVLLLDDILVYCNHDTDAEEAMLKWRRRCKKFNFQNVFAEMYTCDRNVAEEFSGLEQYPNKICFVPFRADSPFLMKLERYDNQEEFWETVVSNAGNGKNCLKYNLVDLLCMDECIRSR